MIWLICRNVNRTGRARGDAGTKNFVYFWTAQQTGLFEVLIAIDLIWTKTLRLCFFKVVDVASLCFEDPFMSVGQHTTVVTVMNVPNVSIWFTMLDNRLIQPIFCNNLNINDGSHWNILEHVLNIAFLWPIHFILSKWFIVHSLLAHMSVLIFFLYLS
jgi:hypothetical protein